MNKKVVKRVVPIILILCVIFYCFIQYSKKSFKELIGMDELNITKVSMVNGSTGNKVETNDKVKIQELVNLLDNRDYQRSFEQGARTGYSYYYEFYIGDKNALRISGSGNNVQINSTYFHVSKEISADSLSKWFDSFPIKSN